MELNRLVPQLSAMQIALSCRVFLRHNRQQSVLSDALFFLFSHPPPFLFLLVPPPYRKVIICSPAAPLRRNASDVPSFHPPPSPCALFCLSCRFTATPTWPPTASTTSTRGECLLRCGSRCRCRSRRHDLTNVFCFLFFFFVVSWDGGSTDHLGKLAQC